MATPTAQELAIVLDRFWEDDALPVLSRYTRIPCLSPAYDAGWASAGHLHEAAELLADWCRSRALAAARVQVIDRAGRTPLLVIEVAGTGPAGTVVVYGHLDKQPPQGAWREGLGPYRPVRQGERLYGRGTADDGYSVFAALGALEALEAAGRGHRRAFVLIEASEESGSPDLDWHLEQLAADLGSPDLVVCLDSGCLTYDRIWLTSSLRGIVVATVQVAVLTEGVHSGLAGGLVPSSFRLLRQLLSRVEDERSGRILIPELQAPVPPAQQGALAALAAELGPAATGQLPEVPGLRLPEPAAALVRRAWAPTLAVTGMDGVPPTGQAGNVLRPFTTAKLSLRLPPTVEAAVAADALARVLIDDPPEGATVAVTVEATGQGWLAPEPAAWVARPIEAASRAAFGRPPGAYGEGGTIPFLATLGARFPGSQMVATGVLGPGSNAHGPNEFLHLPMAKAVTLALALLLAGEHDGDEAVDPGDMQKNGN